MRYPPARSAMTQAAYQFGLDTLLYERWMVETDPGDRCVAAGSPLPTEAA
ncbi:MAG: hypothetical protein R3E66_06260 [bacterium]